MDLGHLAGFAQLGRLQIALAPVENFDHLPGFLSIQNLNSTELVQLGQQNPIQALSASQWLATERQLAVGPPAQALTPAQACVQHWRA